MKLLVIVCCIFMQSVVNGNLVPKSTWKQLDSNHFVNNNSRLVGGSLVSSGGAPYHVAIYIDGVYRCTGAFVGPKYVLTTAYCVTGYESQPNLLQIRYGTPDKVNGIRIGVGKIVRHPQYSPTSLHYDIALLKLNYQFSPGTNAVIVRLTNIEPVPLTSLTVTGYDSSNRLVSTTQQIVRREECQGKWNLTNEIINTVVCAHHPSSGPCAGDLGAPLVRIGVLFGVFSWGPSSCPDAVRPNVYTNVAHFKSWIEASADAFPT